MKYLQDKSCYEDLYDKFTVEYCRGFISRSRNSLDGEIKENTDIDPGKLTIFSETVTEVALYCKSGERYLEKGGTIQEWMERDQKRDEALAAEPPRMYCVQCNKEMELVIKDIDLDIKQEDKQRVFYLFRCDPCREKRGVYSNGEPYIFKHDYCPKCNMEWERISTRKENRIKTISRCKSCGHTDTVILDLSEKPKSKKIDKDFEKDRTKYCLSKEAGEEYRSSMINLTIVTDRWKDRKLHAKEITKAEHTKILTVADLSALLSATLTKANYVGLVISNIDVNRDLIISITIQDTKSGRCEYDSKRDLRRLLVSMLEGTNWNLMSEGISYKLGILSGRLRGQDSTEHIYQDLKKV